MIIGLTQNPRQKASRRKHIYTYLCGIAKGKALGQITKSINIKKNVMLNFAKIQCFSMTLKR